MAITFSKIEQDLLGFPFGVPMFVDMGPPVFGSM